MVSTRPEKGMVIGFKKHGKWHRLSNCSKGAHINDIKEILQYHAFTTTYKHIFKKVLQ